MAWSDVEKEYVKKNAKSMSAKELADGLTERYSSQKSTNTVREMAKKLGIPPRGSGGRHNWTTKELEFVDQNKDTMSIGEMANKLRVGAKSVKARMYKQNNNKQMTQVSPWVANMLRPILNGGLSLFDLSCQMQKQGKIVEIRNNNEHLMALFSRDRRPQEVEAIKIPVIKCKRHPEQNRFDKFNTERTQVWSNGMNIASVDGGAPSTKKVTVICPVCKRVLWTSGVVDLHTRITAKKEE